VADAAAFLHAQGLCHADIKPENLLLTSKDSGADVKLVDFGLTTEVRDGSAHLRHPSPCCHASFGLPSRSFLHLPSPLAPSPPHPLAPSPPRPLPLPATSCPQIRNVSEAKPGTFAYWPPEGFVDSAAIGKPTDMWSIGVVLFVLLSGYHPFDPTGEADDDELIRRIQHNKPDFDDPVWEQISSSGRSLINSLLCADPKRRLTIEQLLQHPWLLQGGSATSEPLVQTEARLKQFRKSTAALRAAVFATILQQQQQRSSNASGGSGGSGRGPAEATQDPGAAAPSFSFGAFFGRAKPQPQQGKGTASSAVAAHRPTPPPSEELKRFDSAGSRGRMLEAEMLASAFRVFDPEGKGFITESDLGRVLDSLGQRSTTAQELHATLAEATRADREGRRVLYGDFVELMTSTEKRRYAKGDVIFHQGDPPDGFHLLLSGSVAVQRDRKRVDTLNAGEYFGETALLSDAPRQASIVCLESVEVLQLSREDFETGFLHSKGRPPPVSAGSRPNDGVGVPSSAVRSAEAAARQALGFIQMVSHMHHSTLRKGEAAFLEGDEGDRFFIIEDGEVLVEAQGRTLNRLHAGDCFGELALIKKAPRNATVRCDSSACRLLSMDVAAFSTLMRRSAVVHQDLESLARSRDYQANAEKSDGQQQQQQQQQQQRHGQKRE
jgi:CRP-like cAMP-binding protein